MMGCSKNFLERPPTDQLTDGSFYQNDDQLYAGTQLLYSKVWFDYNDKASFNLGDFRAGTVYSMWNYQDNVRFNTNGNTIDNGSAWRSFYNVIAQSNLAISNINTYAGPDVTPAVKEQTIAEARFMRATAYRFLVMNWGAVPIIEDNLKHLGDTGITRNTVPSVWRFITREYRAAAEILPLSPPRPGRITRWAAEGMLARTYLVRAGVEGTGANGRKQEFLDSAKYFAERVITMSGAQLLGNYADLFLFPYDNNKESLFELQWVYSGPNAWGTQNSAPAYFTYSGDIANGDGWGGDVSATFWMLANYEGMVKRGDTAIAGRTLDQRLKATFMLPGASYPEITQSINGGEQKLIFPYVTGDFNFVSVKKYVVGKAKDVDGQAASQRYGHDTYMLRLAEMYLIYAEATLGNNAQTDDAKALEYFNRIRTRAGLPRLEDPVTHTPMPITQDIIQKERFIEFAMEGQAWYDLVSLHYYNPEKAYAILEAQDRGLFRAVPDVFPNPTQWLFEITTWDNNRHIVANAGNFQLPIPSPELAQAPNLNKEPVDY
ncbi:hypothetical protein FPE01S_03_06900 [Flavihumibacter petaseus NBRC 106054]|uniref:RagB/SusD family nutrient uptake outer membrane protein n=2 Tax=Flavihumibacter TaxID=1004301 RepID=A0A0E9N4Q2_9BACT|nr:hypothetical protein FPE01S_03_06900 [Flavihumibacter petaseus NBRC 106054]